MLKDFNGKQDYSRLLRNTRSKFRRISSLDLIPESPNQEEDDEEEEVDKKVEIKEEAIESNKENDTILTKSSLNHLKKNSSLLIKTFTNSTNGYLINIIFFWPKLIIHCIQIIIRILLCIPLSIAAPSFWLSALLWIFWKLIRIPIGFFKFLLFSDSINNTYGLNKLNNGKKRTILISCGSTIQTLHLARNLYLSGARVIVIEFDGLFGLTRFSTAVDKFYVVPRPTPENIDNYIAALCHIVRKEKPIVYVPVCATSPAYYDSVAKPHLELLGCATFITGIQETLILDDCLQLYQRCASHKIQLPPYICISSLAQLWELYDNGFMQQFRNILVAVGIQGIFERFKYVLPRHRKDLKFCHEISERHHWLVIRDIPGDHFVTCTTVKNSQVVSNVTCRIDHDTRNLIPITSDVTSTSDTSKLIDHWLKVFFSKVRFQRRINCHMSFRLIKCLNTEEFIPLGVRLGVSLPYICYNHSKIEPISQCSLNRVRLGSLSLQSPENNTAHNSSNSISSLSKFSIFSLPLDYINEETVLDKRESLFTYWDPLPYCAYYHFQVPMKSVKNFLQKQRQKSTKPLCPRITMPVH